MIYIPFISRLSFVEYQGMVIAILFFVLERILRLALFIFPIDLVSHYTPSWLKQRLCAFWGTSKQHTQSTTDMNSFEEIMRYWDYPFEDHLVETPDGYILGIHRISGKQRACDDVEEKRPVVLFWHGFMLNSECFVCHAAHDNILPLRLADAGYDVWLGNSRGNKYSYKHRKWTPSQREFWNFSIDEIANVDVPTTIEYILNTTNAQTLTYVGFSQGTAQMLMALSRNAWLNTKVSHFVGLAPASTPYGFHNAIVDYFVRATPHMLYLLFGRRRALGLVYFWINALPRTMYVAALDWCVCILFNWRMRNLSLETKRKVYWHLYSYTSVKSIVHWMQIIRSGQLRMYDEDPPVYPPWGVNRGPGPVTHWSNVYPLGKIATKITLFYGCTDSLSSVESLAAQLAVRAEITGIEEYEHLDFLWADSVGRLVYPQVLSAMGVKE